MQNKEQAVGVDQLKYHSRWSTPQRGHEVRQPGLTPTNSPGVEKWHGWELNALAGVCANSH